jgi:hypothetical protein
VLADWKSSKGIYGETALQTAAYASAEFYAPDKDTELPLPDIDSTGVVHVEEGMSTFYPLSSSPAEIAECFRVFRHVQYIANRIDWIKGLVGEAWQPESAVEEVA